MAEKIWKRGHNPEKCGLGPKFCVRCQMWVDYRSPDKAKAKAERSKRSKRPRKLLKDKPPKLTGYGRLSKDLDGNIIVPFEAKKDSELCVKCKMDCKQKQPTVVCGCPFFDPLVPRKKRARVVEE